jgi:hypothetical protein
VRPHPSLKAVVQSLDELGLPNLYAEWQKANRDPSYLAARGAAKVGRVWQGSTWGCVERCAYDEDARPENDGEGVSLAGMFKSRTYWNESCVIGECHFK